MQFDTMELIQLDDSPIKSLKNIINNSGIQHYELN